jgi:hypothetical protein
MKRSVAIQAINELPKDFDLDMLFERLLFIEKIEAGLKQEAKGKLLTQASVKKHFEKKWAR